MVSNLTRKLQHQAFLTSITCVAHSQSRSRTKQTKTKNRKSTPVSTPRRQRSTSIDLDFNLMSKASIASKLHPTRKALRKKLGIEPHIFYAVHHASLTDTSFNIDLSEWRSVFSARNEITVKWLWLVTAVARKAHREFLQGFPEMSAALSLSDLIQEGVCGLMKSVELWDPKRDFAFDAYAFYSIKHSVLRAIENQSRPIRLPVHVLNKLSKMRKIREQVELTNGEDLSIHQIAKMAGIDINEAQLYLSSNKTTWSLDMPLEKKHDGTAPTLHEFLVDHTVDVARQVERQCTREAVAELIRESKLEHLEHSVVWLKYGLGDGVERMRAEVSRILDVRVEKVRRAELSALKKLRDTIEEDLSAWTALIS